MTATFQGLMQQRLLLLLQIVSIILIRPFSALRHYSPRINVLRNKFSVRLFTDGINETKGPGRLDINGTVTSSGQASQKAAVALTLNPLRQNIEITRGAFVQIIEQSWARVNQLVSESTLSICEEELKGATSLLVLATVRRSADDSPVSRATVQGMFHEADVNKDGHLTFMEWYEWLGSASTPETPLGSPPVEIPPPVEVQGEPASSTVSIAESNPVSTSTMDPMITALSLVLGNAVCTLKTAARISQDPSALSAAFISGGMMAGVLDAQVCRTMLSRLSPATRELVTLALTLESASLPASFRDLVGSVNRDDLWCSVPSAQSTASQGSGSSSVKDQSGDGNRDVRAGAVAAGTPAKKRYFSTTPKRVAVPMQAPDDSGGVRADGPEDARTKSSGTLADRLDANEYRDTASTAVGGTTLQDLANEMLLDSLVDPVYAAGGDGTRDSGFFFGPDISMDDMQSSLVYDDPMVITGLRVMRSLVGSVPLRVRAIDNEKTVVMPPEKTVVMPPGKTRSTERAAVLSMGEITLRPAVQVTSYDVPSGRLSESVNVPVETQIVATAPPDIASTVPAAGMDMSAAIEVLGDVMSESVGLETNSPGLRSDAAVKNNKNVSETFAVQADVIRLVDELASRRPSTKRTSIDGSSRGSSRLSSSPSQRSNVIISERQERDQHREGRGKSRTNKIAFDPPLDIVQTVDLTAVPLVSAPPIDFDDGNGNGKLQPPKLNIPITGRSSVVRTPAGRGDGKINLNDPSRRNYSYVHEPPPSISSIPGSTISPAQNNQHHGQGYRNVLLPQFNVSAASRSTSSGRTSGYRAAARNSASSLLGGRFASGLFGSAASALSGGRPAAAATTAATASTQNRPSSSSPPPQQQQQQQSSKSYNSSPSPLEGPSTSTSASVSVSVVATDAAAAATAVAASVTSESQMKQTLITSTAAVATATQIVSETAMDAPQGVVESLPSSPPAANTVSAISKEDAPNTERKGTISRSSSGGSSSSNSSGTGTSNTATSNISAASEAAEDDDDDDDEEEEEEEGVQEGDELESEEVVFLPMVRSSTSDNWNSNNNWNSRQNGSFVDDADINSLDHASMATNATTATATSTSASSVLTHTGMEIVRRGGGNALTDARTRSRRSGRKMTKSSGLALPVQASQQPDQQWASSKTSLSVVQATQLAEVLGAAADVASDLARLRADLQDLDDAQAAVMRKVITSQAGGRTDVMGLAMALRATRLQHAARFPVHVKQQLALETLQLWAPLSFQVGLSNQLPELEVHSYVLLFPRSFGTFVDWYGRFHPLARSLLKSFRASVQRRLQDDPLMPALCSKVTIQSRLKTANSSFKKMVKGAKQRENLHDMLGIRIIVTPNSPSAFEPLEPPLYDASSTFNATLGSDAELLANISATAESAPLGDGPLPPGTESNSSSTSLQDYRMDREDEARQAEEEAVWRVYDLVCDCLSGLGGAAAVGADDAESSGSGAGSGGWIEDKSRFKDYVTVPKPSGYQSLHMTIMHKASGVSMEVQIRSARMHWVAEYGPAAHSQYKALVLPSTSTASETSS